MGRSVRLLLAATAGLVAAGVSGDACEPGVEESSLLQVGRKGRRLGSIDCTGASDFTVEAGDTCWAYGQACPDMSWLCCAEQGKTCTAEKSALTAGDRCFASPGGTRSCSGPAPSPTPPSPSSLAIGQWVKSWKPTVLVPSADMSVCFSGEVDVALALSACSSVSTTGERWLGVGGGNCDSYDGRDVSWSSQQLQGLIDKVSAGGVGGYAGVMFDLEADGAGCKAGGSTCGAGRGDGYGDTAPASLFEEAFRAVKEKGMKVAVSWSYQMPYCMMAACDIVAGALGSANVDIVSPQMYGGGSFTSHEYAAASFNGNCGVGYKDYSGSSNAIRPSYTLPDGQADESANRANLEEEQSAMISWARSKGYEEFVRSPGCLAYQNQ